MLVTWVDAPHTEARAAVAECAENSPRSGSQACEDQQSAVFGAVVLVGLVLGVLLFWWMRRLARRAEEEASPGVARRRRSWVEAAREWPQRRRQDRRDREAAQQRLLEEYIAAYDAGDPDLRRTSRDFYDNDNGVPWALQVGVAAYVVGLMVSVGLLMLLFEGIKHVTQRLSRGCAGAALPARCRSRRATDALGDPRPWAPIRTRAPRSPTRLPAAGSSPSRRGSIGGTSGAAVPGWPVRDQAWSVGAPAWRSSPDRVPS